jgi:hypothetical protein
MGQLLIKMEGQFEISREKSAITFYSQLRFVTMKSSLVAYDFKELNKKSELKIINMNMLKPAQYSQRPKFGRSNFLGLSPQSLG